MPIPPSKSFYPAPPAGQRSFYEFNEAKEMYERVCGLVRRGWVSEAKTLLKSNRNSFVVKRDLPQNSKEEAQRANTIFYRLSWKVVGEALSARSFKKPSLEGTSTWELPEIPIKPWSRHGQGGQL